MSASDKSDSVYNSFGAFMERYLEPGKPVRDPSFSICENGVMLKFNRVMIPSIEYAETFVKHTSFISHRDLIEKYSRWGRNDVKFSLAANDELILAYEYSFDSVVLPNLVKALSPNQFAVTESGIYFDEEPAAKIIEEVENELTDFLRDAYIKSIQHVIQ